MKGMRRILAMLLAVVMVVGLIPATVFAADIVLDAAIFCSDVHKSTSDLSSVLSGVATSGVTYSSIGFVGDTCLTVANTTSIVTSALGHTPKVMFCYADSHDTENSSDIADDWDYSGEVEGVSDYYLVYTIRETDMQNASDATTAAPAFTTWYNGLTAAEKKLPIFIMSHRPLHDRRDDNAGAPTWYSAISAAAESSDIVVFWAHNHTNETDVDTAAYYVAKDGTETFTVYNGDTVVPNFTYMNAGYINANGQNPARKGIATTVKITADSLIFQDYNSSGEYSGTYAHNVTVKREFAAAEVTLSSIAISGTTSYYVGDELDLTVTATYSDGNTADVTSAATLSGYDMSTAGTQTVTATYEGLTATTSITVTAVQINSIAVTTQPTKVTYTTGEELDTTGMVVTATYNNGTTAEVTGWYTSAVDMTTAGEKEVTVNYVVDSITYKTTFTITVEQGVAEGVYLTGIEITKAPNKTEYLLSQSLDLDGMVVVATFSDGSTVELQYKPFSTSSIYGGYELYNFSMYVEKAHELAVVYTFGDVTCYDTTTINVWNEDFADENTGVKVHVADEDYGVTAVKVSPSSNSNVSLAIKDVIKAPLTAYDITLTLDADGYALTNGNKTVTLPIPTGVNNPVVYYVPESGAAEPVTITAKTDTTVTFETNHFSTYVIGESTEIEVPKNETADGSTTTGGTTTTTKTVYVLSSGNPSGEVLIADANTATTSAHLVANDGGDLSNVTTTVYYGDCDGDGDSEYYIELTETEATNSLWTVSNSYRFVNQSEYLRCSNGSLSVSSQNTTWSYSSNRLSYKGKNSTYYLRYNNGWTVTTTSSSASSIYFYVPTEVDVTVDTSVTKSGTYEIKGEDLSVAVSEGSTANLTSILTFTPDENNTATVVSPVDVSTTATYEIVTKDINGNTVNGDPNGIIDSISEDGVVTFTGNYGTALVKVSYESDFGTVTDYITVEATAPYYTIDITDGTKGETDDDGNTTYPSVTSTIALKGITEGQTYDLNHVLSYHTTAGVETSTATVTWTSSNENVATVDANGLVTLAGAGGSTTITVTYQVDENTSVTDSITITASKTNYYTPADGGENFPAFPNEGAVRFDKTATAVGNFSQTGISQVELSMTGVPYTTGSQIDVVLMLDITGSMKDVTSTVDGTTVYTRIVSTVAAAKAFARTIVLNEDGTYNKNRIGIYSFNSGGTYTLHALSAITDIDKLEAEIDTFADDYATGGTPYDDGLALVQSTLAAAKTDGTGNNRQQFAVFMTDGCPTSYKGTTNEFSSASAIKGMFTGTNYNTRDTDYEYEYYSTAMKTAGVTVYTVGLGLNNTNSAWQSSSAAQCYNAASILLNDISGPAYEGTQPDALSTSTLSKKDSYFFSIDDADAATNMANIFSGIAQSILEAATDVIVTDKIADAYTMVFDIPTGSQTIEGLDSQEFYIEVKEYALDSNHERTTSTSLMKLYLKNTNGVYSAASDANGTAYASPVFGTTAIGTMFYWTTTENTDSGVSVTVDGTTYYFVASGKSNTASDFNSTVWFNMTSGAYAYGTVDASTNMSTNMIIATPYFVYNASTRMLVWTAEKLSSTELALSYFLYLDRSATEVGTDKEIDADTYPTNDYAYLSYTNYKGNSCYQEFPKPQMTWNGAQVTYVFYLVNAAGQPVNQYGQVVDFANAVFVTAPVTESVVWNEETEEGVASLDVNWAAEKILPTGYTIYDADANYELHVYETETGELAGINRFIISGSEANGNTSSTTKVYNTKAGTKYSAYGTYTSGTVTGTATTVLSDFDFANTTVAFAVTWYAHLLPDVVVVDYGLPVAIEVLANDMVSATLNSVSTTPYSTAYEMNTGVADSGFAALTDGYIRLENGDTVAPYGDAVYYVQKDMQFNEPATFYYDAQVTYYKDSNKLTGYIYSQVTVIPATTVYYEDSFLTLAGDGTEWETVGEVATNNVQGTDRPGVGNLNDANNIYGYDSVNGSYATYSMGSAQKVHVDANSFATATFSFYGTGFDVIGMTSNDTGILAVKVVKDGEDKATVTKIVDTYYGYAYGKVTKVYTYTWQEATDKLVGTYSWVLTSSAPTTDSDKATDIPANPVAGNIYTAIEEDWYPVDAETDTNNDLYQVPVIKVDGLDYAKYTVTITATYMKAFDHTTEDGYDLYLDAIRVYDPTGVVEGTVTNDVVSNAYKADGEGWPSYQELRDMLLTEEDFNAGQDDVIEGVMFIDGIGALKEAEIANYSSYGPNNEVYLAPGQGVAFALSPADYVHVGLRRMGGTATYTIQSIGEDGTVLKTVTADLSSGTDMYYDITDLKDGTIVISNSGESGDLMITNLKFTFDSNPANAQVAMFMTMRRSATVLGALNSVDTDSDKTDDTVTGDTTDTEVDDTVTGDNNNSGNTDTETDDAVTGETHAPESDNTVTDEPDADKPAEELPEEEIPEVDTPAEDETTGEAPAEQLGFWARLWNAIKSAFNRLFSWFGF